MAPSVDENEVRHMTEYLRGGGWLTEFRKTMEFEEMIASFTGAAHCVAVANGTVSMAAAYMARGIGPGDEVLVPDLTMIATPNAVRMVGSTPVLVDVEPATLCMDLAIAERAVTARTKAVALVSLNGRAPDMRAWRAFCDSRGLFLLEDAAQSLGSNHAGTHLGRFGHVGSFSFSAAKIVTTGQGGAVVTDDGELAGRLRKIKDFGRVAPGVDQHDVVGTNFKFTDLQAVIGIEQMKKLSARVERKRAMYMRYVAGLSGANGVELLPMAADAVPWFIDIYVDNPAGLQAHLHTAGIGSRTVYPAIHTQPIYPGASNFPVASRAASRGLWLPSSVTLDDATIDRVCAAVRESVPR